MSRKPVSKLSLDDTREAIWNIIRRLQEFTIKDVACEIRLDGSSIADYIQGLCRAKYIEITRRERGTPNRGGLPQYHYRLIKDIGVDAPRVRKDGGEVTQGRGREQMWQSMRILKDFSAVDLAFNSSTDEHKVSEAEALNYIGFLHKAGYLVLTAASKPGHKPGTGTRARYRLLPTRWSGPRPPQVQRVKNVYDANLKKVVWSSEGGAE